MPRIKEGFKGERAIVLPAFLIEELKQDPLGSELYITDIGYYPHACFHYRKRNTEEATEFILIYCMEGEGWFELDKHRYVVPPTNFSFYLNTRHTLMAVMREIPGLFTGSISMEQKLHFSVPVLTVRKTSLHKRIHESKKD